MDLNSLNAFIQVAERKSFSLSAKALKITQPAVSKRVASLEAQLASKLFDRVGRSVHLTEAGRLLLPTAVRIRSEISRVENAICNIGANTTGKLSIGATECIASHWLSPVLKEYKESFDEVDIEVNAASAEQLIDKVTTGTFELALCPMHESSVHQLPQNISQTALFKSNLKIAVAKTSPLVLQPVVTVKDLINTKAILPPSNTLARRAIDEKLAALGLTPEVSVEAAQFHSMKSLASAGLGWACLPSHKITDGLVQLEVENLELPFAITLIRRKDISLSRAAKEFIGTLPMNSDMNTDMNSSRNPGTTPETPELNTNENPATRDIETA